MHSWPALSTVPTCACLCVHSNVHTSVCVNRCACVPCVHMPCLGAWGACSSVGTDMRVCMCRHKHTCHTGLPCAHLCALMHLKHVHLTMDMLSCLGVHRYMYLCVHKGGGLEPALCLPFPANRPSAQFQAFSRLKRLKAVCCY